MTTVIEFPASGMWPIGESPMASLALRNLPGILAAVALALLPVASARAQSPDPIRVALNDWAGQHISSRIMGALLETAGFCVDYVKVDYLRQFAALERGGVSVAMEIWATAGTAALEAAVATGRSSILAKPE